MKVDWRDLGLRIGLISTALILFSAAVDIWTRGEAFRSAPSLLLSFSMWLLATGVGTLAVVRKPSTRASWLILVGLILSILARAYVSHQTFSPLTTQRTDNEMIAQFAVEALQAGENPYDWNFSDILRVFREQGGSYTPFLDGAFQHRVTYPALPTLLVSLFDYASLDLGQGEVRVVGLIVCVLLLIVLFLGASESLRPVVLLPLFILPDILLSSLNGVQDIVWSLLLVSMIYAWKRPLWRAVLFGLACSFRQQPWFIAPFLLVYIWRHSRQEPGERLREILFFVAVSVSVFAIANLPFILWDPQAWLRGALEPSYAAFNYLSYGPAILSEYGLAALPRQFYTGLQASTYVVLLVGYWFYAPAIGQGFWIFPGVFFWLYYRGLPSYWVYWIPVLLATVGGGAAGAFVGESTRPYPARRTRHTVPVIVAVGLLFTNLVWAVTLLRQEAQVEVSFTPPIETFYSELGNRLRVTVINQSDRPLTPRFSVRPDYGVQLLPWRILAGPEYLPPGAAGEYVIDAKELPSRGFNITRGAQLAVTDAGGDYSLYATLSLPPLTGLENPDHITNPDYVYWAQGGIAPLGWTLIPEPTSSARLYPEAVDGRQALIVETQNSVNDPELPAVRLQQVVTVPNRFSIWVHPSSSDTHPAERMYGIEIDDGKHRAWILFGDPAQPVALQSSDQATIHMQAPMDTWSQHAIDLGILYEQLGWDWPLPSPRMVRDTRYSAPQAKLSLIVRDRSSDVARQAFGPIEQEEGYADPDAALDNALDHPDRYYVQVGNKYRSQRNYSLAEDAYTRALQYNALNSEAHFGLGEAYFWIGNYEKASEAFQQALVLDLPNPGTALKGLGWSEYNQGDYQAARQHFEGATTALVACDNPNDVIALADAYNGLGWTWLQLDDCARAMIRFGQALDIAPGLPGASEGMALCVERGF